MNIKYLTLGIITLFIISNNFVLIGCTNTNTGKNKLIDNKNLTNNFMTLSYVKSSSGLPSYGQWPWGTRVGDLDNDGDMDIIRLRGHDDFNPEDQGFQIWLGDGTGKWTKTNIPNGNFGYGGTAIGDFNNDGYLDGAYGVHHNRNHPLIGAWAGDGGTSFTEKSEGLGTDGETWGMASIDFGDFNNDGLMDIGVGSFTGENGIRAYLNHDAGDSWSSKSYGLPHNEDNPNVGNWLIWDDINRDGYLDIIIATQIINTGEEHFFWLGDGTGSWTANDFGLPVEYLWGSYGLDIGDVNNDGWIDIVFIKHIEQGNDDWFIPVVYIFDGEVWTIASDGLPNPSNSPEIEFGPLAFGDLDNDGNLDLIGLEGYSTGSWPYTLDWTEIHAWLGDGTGNWSEIYVIDTDIPGWPQSVTLADIDHNNYLDIVISSDRDDYQAGGIRVYKETTTASQLEITLRKPIGGGVYISGSLRKITWTTSIPSDKGTVSLYYSVTGKQGPWYTIVDNVTDSNYYQWIIPNISTNNGYLKGIVYLNNERNSSVNPISFSIIGGNTPPDTPIIEGPSSGNPHEGYNFSIRTTDPDDNMIKIFIDWGDGTTSGWLGPYSSGEAININHSWENPGTYNIKAIAKDEQEIKSAWSDPFPIIIFTDVIDIRITGGFGINIAIRNTGDQEITDLVASVYVKGGIFDRINISRKNDIPSLLPGEEEHIKILPIGLGKLTTHVTVETTEIEEVIKTANGFLVLFVIFIQ